MRLLDTEPAASEVFRMSDETVLLGIKGVSDIITESGEINIDFADIEGIMKDAGTVLMGIGQASGENQSANRHGKRYCLTTAGREQASGAQLG